MSNQAGSVGESDVDEFRHPGNGDSTSDSAGLIME
jgi:hypothetical protein